MSRQVCQEKSPEFLQGQVLTRNYEKSGITVFVQQPAARTIHREFDPGRQAIERLGEKCDYIIEVWGFDAWNL